MYKNVSKKDFFKYKTQKGVKNILKRSGNIFLTNQKALIWICSDTLKVNGANQIFIFAI